MSLRFAPMACRVGAATLWVVLAACSSTPQDETAGMSVQRVYSEARDDAAAGNYERAIRLYERLEGRAAGTLLAQQAMLELAHTYYRSGQRAQALATIERYMKLYPTSAATDYALYLKGLINFNDNLGLFGRFSGQSLSERDQQASKESYQAFRQLVDLYPDSVYASDAQARMNFIVNSLAQYEVSVARYYFRRGAYVAAANRAQLAVQEYQQSPVVEEALHLLALSYDRLGLPELRDDALRVLRLNFPQSTILGQAHTTSGR
jgi:outer membrane protein assembly factor BamD